MATITLKGNAVHTSGELPTTGSKAPDFSLVAADLSTRTRTDFEGKRIVMNIFPSLDTATCAASVRRFNEMASSLENTSVLCISRDLPFAQKRFCGAEGLDNVITLSDFATGAFGRDYGLQITDGPLAHLLSRAVVVVNADGTVSYTQQVPEISEEPDYDDVMAHL